MRRTTTLLMLVLSVVFGVIAVIFAAAWEDDAGTTATSKVVVAAREIPVGTPLDPDATKIVDWPRAAKLEGSFENPDAIKGRVTKVAVAAGEPLLESKLAPPGASGGLAASIAPGRRAITVKVNEVVGVAGFALPGNHVDVLVNMKDPQDRPISKIVLERILVLAIAQESQRDDTKPKVVNAVTLEVTPEQAERLDLARSVGTLSLVLRNQVDTQAAVTTGARPAELLGAFVAAEEQRRAAPPPAPAARPATAPEPRPREQAAVPPRAPSRSSAERAAPAREVELIRGVQRDTVAIP